MPKGPNGQKRPADVIGDVVTPGRVGTCEASGEVRYVASNTETTSASGKARAQHLFRGERSKIAKAGAKAIWKEERRAEMTHEEQLMNALFGNPQRELVDIKFFLSQGIDVTREDVCREAVKMLEQMDAGEGADSTFAEEFEQKDVRELFA